ncbi:MAG: tRNA lysidine(34) synthetase TilS [Negativicutes bacterium]|nr:tRNA lysidine(34) synthetase TilS [Negativicutes bacterium]
MLTKVRLWIERHRLIAPGDKILAACSGGADSLSLVHLLHRLVPEYGLTLAVAHVNHMFRGAESEADAAFVGQFCARLGLMYHQADIDVPHFIRNNRYSPQEAARILRYRYLRQVAATMGGAKIATGHQRDDQAETVLLNLLRGAGSAGMTGMNPADDDVIRPLLGTNRIEIETYCREHALAPRFDSSNLKTDYLRNYLRLEILPLLKTRFNANVTEALCRTARLVGDEHQFIIEAVGARWPDVVREEGELLEVDCRRLNALHIALGREVFRQVIAKKRGSLKGITFFHVERLLELAASGSVGSVVELPGELVARRGYHAVIFETPMAVPTAAGVEWPEVELLIPGVTAIPALNLTVTAKLLDTRPQDLPSDSALFDWRQLMPPLWVRARREGDRFRPAGGAGSKKLKEFFIDTKIPREKRDRIPLFCDQQGIVWVGGHRQAERARPDESTGCFLQLSIQQED